MNLHNLLRCAARAALAGLCAAAFLCPAESAAGVPDRRERLSAQAGGYLERARVMLGEGNYAGVIDQLRTLDTLGASLSAADREECAYLLAMAMYHRGDPECIEALKAFSRRFPSSARSLQARLSAADFLFFSHDFNGALEAYRAIDFSRISPGDRPLYDYRLALSLTRCGLGAEARPIFNRLTGKRGFELPALYYLAYLDYSDGNLEKARGAFSRVEAAYGNTPPDGICPLYYLAQIDYAEGKYAEAASKARTLLEGSRAEGDELTADTQRILGLSLFKCGREEEARKWLQAYMRHDFTPAADAVYALGVIDYNEGNTTGARKRFGSLTDLNNDLAQSAFLYLGQIAVQEGDNNAAAISFEKASSMHFDSAVTETALYNYLAARTHGGNIPFGSSIPLLTGFLKEYPGSRYAGQVREYLATAYYHEKDYSRALESLNSISRPTAAVTAARQKTLYMLGTEALSAGKPREARRWLEEASSLQADPSVAAQSMLWLGDACYALGDWGAAVKAYRTFLAKAPRDANAPLARYDLAYALLMQGHWKEAARDFSEALKGGGLPGKLADDALVRLADAQYYSGDHRSARRSYTAVIESGNRDAAYATFRRAVMMGLDGDLNGKLSELSAMKSRFPGSPWIANALLEKGQTYTALGQTERAVEAFEELRLTDRQGNETRKGLLNLALAYAKEGNGEKAAEAYTEIIAKWPSSEEASLANDDLRRIHAGRGTLTEYAAFLKTVPGAPSIDASQIETLTFEAAETAFGNNAVNTSLLEKYVEQYPDGRNLAQALLDIATGKDESGKPDEAVAALDRLLAQRPDAPQVPEALMLRAGILEDRGAAKAQEALKAFRELERRGGTEYAPDAWAGIMRLTDNSEERRRYAALVKNAPGIPAEQVAEAEFLEAVAGLDAEGKANEEARTALARLAANPKTLFGAQAAVVLGEYLLENGDVNGADKVLTAFTDEGSPHEYWLARGFIALADVNHVRGKDYLAKEYLKSLRDNYPGKEPDIHDMISTRLKKWK